MGDCLWACQPAQYVTNHPGPGRLSLLSSMGW